MNDVRGMSLKQFNHVIEEMRKLYPFTDNHTYISNLRDEISNSQKRVEIITIDEPTGIQIVLSKGVDLDYREDV